jgi:hypothetical protein
MVSELFEHGIKATVFWPSINVFDVSAVHMSPPTFKIVVSLFHTVIATPSRKTILESGLQGPYLMIWGRSAADNSRTCLHVPLEHTAVLPHASILGQLPL